MTTVNKARKSKTPTAEKEFEAYLVESIQENAPKKRKNNSQKGKRVERELVHLLNARFAELFKAHPEWGEFSRSVGSGNRWGQRVCLPQHAKDTFTGDLTCPAAFKFVIESKGGYDVDMLNVFDGGSAVLDSFIKQVSHDAGKSKRKPWLIWKADRRPRLSFFLKSDVLQGSSLGDYWFSYREWVATTFDQVMTWPDEFFFDL